LILSVEPFLFDLLNKRENNVLKLKKLIKETLSSLPQDYLERRIFFRKFTGEGDLTGILDYIPLNSTVIEYNQIDKIGDNEDSFILGPMNMDELTFFYKKILNQKFSIYPLTHQLLASKFYRNIMFYPHVPKMVFIPQDSFSLIKDYDFDSFFQENNVERVIIKDEFGFHTGQTIPYKILPPGTINKEILRYKEKAGVVEDIGGLIIEEFLAEEVSEVFKCHIFGEIIPKEILKYKVSLAGLEGILKSFIPNEPQLLSNVETTIGTLNQEIIDLLNPHIERYLPYSFSSVDFLIKSKKPIIIDVNSKAGSLGEIQEIKQSDDHNPFSFFYKRCLNTPSDEYLKQVDYLNKITSINNKIRLLDGIFTVTEATAVDLLTDKKYNLTIEEIR
jgi:hypothetical protein